MSHTFRGSPQDIGRMCGSALQDGIRSNVTRLVRNEGCRERYESDPRFRQWIVGQEAAIAGKWPWIREEARAIAEAAGLDYEDILLLNLRAWQYDVYGPVAVGQACSSLAVTMADGTVSCSGALDDPAELYCGPVRIVPDAGYRFVSFPITGTVWGNRGLNSAGLAVGISSQLLTGARPVSPPISQDIAMRVILQTCGNVDEVRSFCQAYAFTLNLVAVDAGGAVFYAHQTPAGLFELPVDRGFAALTNHVADDGVMHRLQEAGVGEFAENATTRLRRGRLLEFARRRNGRCSQAEILELIGARDDANPASIHNAGSLFLTYANPQSDKTTIWIRQPQHADNGDLFTAFVV